MLYEVITVIAVDYNNSRSVDGCVINSTCLIVAIRYLFLIFSRCSIAKLSRKQHEKCEIEQKRPNVKLNPGVLQVFHLESKSRI